MWWKVQTRPVTPGSRTVIRCVIGRGGWGLAMSHLRQARAAPTVAQSRRAANKRRRAAKGRQVAVERIRKRIYIRIACVTGIGPSPNIRHIPAPKRGGYLWKTLSQSKWPTG